MAAPLLLAYMYCFQSDNGVSDEFSIVIYKYQSSMHRLSLTQMPLASLCNGNCDLIKNSLTPPTLKKNSLAMVSTKNRLWFNFFNFIKKLLTVYIVSKPNYFQSATYIKNRHLIYIYKQNCYQKYTYN